MDDLICKTCNKPIDPEGDSVAITRYPGTGSQDVWFPGNDIVFHTQCFENIAGKEYVPEVFDFDERNENEYQKLLDEYIKVGNGLGNSSWGTVLDKPSKVKKPRKKKKKNNNP